jgi:TonB-dependent starch-binding outer membrane protein SusC
VPLQEGRLTTFDTKNRNTLIENYLTYTLSKNSHEFTALAGHSFQEIFIQGRSYGIAKFTGAAVGILDLTSAAT